MKAFRILLVGTMITGILNAQQNPRKEIFFAFFGIGTVSGGGLTTQVLQTEFTVTNPGERTAEVLVRFFGRDGKPLEVGFLFRDSGQATNPFNMSGQSSAIVKVGLFPGFFRAGWVKIESSEPITVLQSINLLEVFDSGVGPATPVRMLSAASLTPSEPIRVFSLSVVEDRLLGSGISIAVSRADAPAVNGTLKLFDNDGSQVAARVISVSVGAQVIQLASELFPELGALGRGTITGEFDGEVIVASVRFGKGQQPLLGTNLVSRRVVQ